MCVQGDSGGGGLVTPHRAISDLQMFVTLSFWPLTKQPYALVMQRACLRSMHVWVGEPQRGQTWAGGKWSYPSSRVCCVFRWMPPPPRQNKKNVGGINSLRQLPCASREKGWTRWHLNCKDEVKIWGAVLFHVLTQGGDGGVWGEAPSLAEARFK